MVDPNKVIETAAGGTITAIIQKLAALTIDNVVSPLWEISDKIEWLKEELQILHAVLVDLSNEEHPTQQEMLWKNKMRELAYDIEDAIDRFMLASNNMPAQSRTQEAQDPSFMEKIKNTIRSCTDRIRRLPSDFGMATKIKHLKQKLSSIEERSNRQNIGRNGDGSSHDSIPIRDVAQYAASVDLVGTEGPSKHIVRLLTEEAGSSARPRKVVAIVGFGGIGKTTLAKQVFDKIKRTFDLKAFVTVSRNLDMKTVLLNVLDSFGLRNDELHHLRHKGVERIIDKLKEYIAEKRYLVVLDDIWKEDVWTSLNAALFDNNCDSNIIVTTRKDEVATASCSANRSHVYRMEPLNPEDSKSLFLNKTFGGRECPPNLERVCHGILKKCAGSPLAILVLSGSLTNKVTVSQWDHVLNTIGSGDSKYNVVRRIISFSYFDLPQHLRTCLMYLSIFPEDIKISRKRLVNRWIAEGFVSSIDWISITKTAEKYFGDLIVRNLIQVVDIKYDGEAQACRVHDTILDFIISKASEENFVSIINNGQQLGRSGNKIRRLSIQHYQDAEGLAAEDLSFLRSITLFGYSAEHLHFTVCLRGSTSLRVLDANDAFLYSKHGAGCFIDFDVATLRHQKYLDLSGLRCCGWTEDFYTQRVLTGISNLQYLETLDLRGAPARHLPTDIYKLRRLVRQFINGLRKLPVGIGQLKALEELDCVTISGSSSLEFLQELGHLTKMVSMNILIANDPISDQHELILVSSLQKLSNLHSLTITVNMCVLEYGISSWQAALQGLRKFSICESQFTKVPDWMSELNHLEKLVLTVKRIEQNDLNILGDMQSLIYLWLGTCNPTERGLTFMNNKGFQCLKYLIFDRVVMAPTFQPGSVPRLEQLDLSIIIITGDSTVPACHVPGIEYLDSLTTVTVRILYKQGYHKKIPKDKLLECAADAMNDIRNAVKNLPNKPTVTLRNYREREG